MNSLEKAVIKGTGAALAAVLTKGNSAAVNGIVRAARSLTDDVAQQHSPFHSAHANVGGDVNDKA